MNAASINFDLRYQSSINTVYLALCFLLPLSAAGISIGFALLALSWVFQGQYRAKGREIFSNPLYVLVLLFFAIHVVGLLWADKSINGFKSWMIFLIPVWATVVSRKVAYKGIYYFVGGMMVAEAGVYYKLAQNWATYLQGGYSNDLFLAMGHISYNPMLAITIAFLLSLLMYRQLHGWRLGLSLFFVVTMTVNMFLTGGRAGQVGLLFAGFFLALYYFRQQPTKMLASILVLCSVFGVAYFTSPLFKQRAELAVHDVLTYQQDANSSVGQRMKFTENSWALLQEAPWIGHGTGSFEASYQRINQLRSPEVPATTNPHNYHALIWVQFGISGFLVYLSLYYMQIRIALRMPDSSEFKPLALLLPAFVFLINFSDSYLWGHHTQALFALLMATLYRQDRGEVK